MQKKCSFFCIVLLLLSSVMVYGRKTIFFNIPKIKNVNPLPILAQIQVIGKEGVVATKKVCIPPSSSINADLQWKFSFENGEILSNTFPLPLKISVAPCIKEDLKIYPSFDIDLFLFKDSLLNPQLCVVKMDTPSKETYLKEGRLNAPLIGTYSLTEDKNTITLMLNL